MICSEILPTLKIDQNSEKSKGFSQAIFWGSKGDVLESESGLVQVGPSLFPEQGPNWEIFASRWNDRPFNGWKLTFKQLCLETKSKI